jgi:hypothetical protein
MSIDNKQKLLIGLVVVLAALLAYRAVKPFRQPTVDKLTYGRASKIVSSAVKSGAGPETGPPPHTMTHLLAAPEPLSDEVIRDPFRRPAADVEPAPQPAAPPPPPSEVTPDERARERLGRFKAFGNFRQDGREALFLQRGKQILVVRAGDRIDGRYKIDAIDGAAVVISSPDLPHPFEFKFEELKPGTASGPRSLSSLTESTARPSPAARAQDFNEADPPDDESDEDSVPAPEQDTDEEIPPDDRSPSDWNVLPTPQNRKTTDAAPNSSISRPLPSPASNSDRFIPDRESD